MNKNLIIVGICILFIGVILAVIFRPAPKPEIIGDLTPSQENELKANLVTLEGQNDSLRKELGKVEVADSVKQEAHKRTITHFKKIIGVLERDNKVVEIRDSFPKIDQLLKAKDSVIVHHEIRVADMEHSAQVTKGINEQIAKNFETRLSQTEQLLHDKTMEVEQSAKEIKKLRRRLTLTKIGGVILLGGIVALSL